jgi:hypothetical protein
MGFDASDRASDALGFVPDHGAADRQSGQADADRGAPTSGARDAECVARTGGRGQPGDGRCRPVRPPPRRRRGAAGRRARGDGDVLWCRLVGGARPTTTMRPTRRRPRSRPARSPTATTWCSAPGNAPTAARRCLPHEVAHVVASGGARGATVATDDAHEAAADDAAAAVTAGRSVAIGPAPAAVRRSPLPQAFAPTDGALAPVRHRFAAGRRRGAARRGPSWSRRARPPMGSPAMPARSKRGSGRCSRSTSTPTSRWSMPPWWCATATAAITCSTPAAGRWPVATALRRATPSRRCRVPGGPWSKWCGSPVTRRRPRPARSSCRSSTRSRVRPAAPRRWSRSWWPKMRGAVGRITACLSPRAITWCGTPARGEPAWPAPRHRAAVAAAPPRSSICSPRSVTPERWRPPATSTAPRARWRNTPTICFAQPARPA